MTKAHAILLAGGAGERLDVNLPKQFMKIAGRTVIEHTIMVFESHLLIEDIILVVNPYYRTFLEDLLVRNSFRKVRKMLNGGATRCESSRIGIMSIAPPRERVLIHDAVRPLLSHRIITDCIKALDRYSAVDVAIPAADTIIQVDPNMMITDIPKRSLMMRGQTPQSFRLGVIQEAHRRAVEENFQSVTDDCGLVLRYGLADVHVVLGEEENIKITYLTDIYMADRLFQLRSAALPNGAHLKGLNGKVVVIFGASRGIGRAIDGLARQHGAKVFGFSRSNAVDVASIRAVREALAQVHLKTGRIDCIVNTAGVIHMGKLEHFRERDLVTEIETNFIGSIHVAQSGLNYLRETEGSLLLFTSSSYTRGRALYSVYSATKAAIVNLVQALAEEFMPDHVRINALNPERTATPMRLATFGAEPAHTLLDSNHVAEMALHTLLSDLTGQVVDVRKKMARID